MEKLLPWFILKSIPGVGNHLFKRLIDRFNSPELVFEASREDLLAVNGISHRIVSAIKQHIITEQVKKDLELAMQKGYRIVTIADPDYPPLLLQIPDPPPFLYVYGSLDRSIKNIAVVGSRNATSYGITTTKQLCAALAALKVIIVSGMAIGIDTAAHEGALMGHGKTIAVLGSGLERVYPAENIKLFHQIAENGAVISEFPLMTEPEAHNFPIRNRVISGIALGTVVVEATKKSGSLITARLAAEQNREVYAVPGSIQSFKSTGTHNLIKQGAKLVENAQDIIEELAHVIKANIATDNPNPNGITDQLPLLSPDESVVLEGLGPYPVHIDDLGRKLAMGPGKLSSILLQLELKGIVQQTPGKLFSTTD
ncbi:MAG: DNA protecting protein DprA [Deltaproteobacteria bacterium CG1_02_45_11]|nr:MAG: DNA protecting protein DprA [Deltaproteobacteria bacterium CG1_02_45_11]